MALEVVTPGYEGELVAFLDQREPPAREVHPAPIDPLDPLARIGLGVRQAELAGELRADLGQLAPTQDPQQVGTIGDLVLLEPRQVLLDQPLLAPGERVLHLTAEARVTGRRRRLAEQLAIEPGGAHGTDLPLERQV